jgi:peptidoglycan hydrolase-like protein with peptidoglycan-binding domain
LTEQGFYSGSIGGHYGSLTASAVKRYQSVHGLQQTGNVGPSTRNVLNGYQEVSGYQE